MGRWCFRPPPVAGGNPSLLSPANLEAFYASLSQDLRHFSASPSNGSVPILWFAEAMKFLKNTQLQLQNLLKGSNLPISSEAEEGWFNQCMKSTAALLDLCNSIKSAVSKINQYRMKIEIAIQKIQSSLDPVELARLKNELHEKLRNSRKVKGTGRPSVGEDDCIAAVMLSAFVRMFEKGEKKGTVGRLMMDAQGDQGEDEERFVRRMEFMGRSSEGFGEGMERFDAAVDDAFGVAIRGRNEMLAIFRERVLFEG
ncbi:Protein BPS1, chloroplastic [Apostasia shenzhenica]|uniref:Protein BPS1, chloroplastic n=1 Tax=Apostasia shenzhenica TaxID=1088818 RepID=A0A2H9ZUI3_9ASPA|nr:Protein BPS1, chloroplastic [Apostasia shenzhenica]